MHQTMVSFIDELLAKLQQFADEEIIIGTDLNLVIHKNLGKSKHGKRSMNRKADSVLQNVLNKFNLIDAWHLQHPREWDYTYYFTQFKFHTHIDYILTSASLVN